MKKIIGIGIITAFIGISGCDYVDVPQQVNTSATINDTVRKVFIEDFTGHTCINCPDAAIIIDSLESIFGIQIVPMAVHYGWFAEPCPPHSLPNGAPAGTFGEDFRVLPEDADYDNIFGSNNWVTFPCGMVNHLGYPSNLPSSHTTWADSVVALLAKPMTAYIKVLPTYNSSSRQLNVQVTGEMMCDTTGTYKIALYLVEDGLGGWQQDDNIPGGFDSAYVFNHVFRGCINTPGSIGGDQVLSGTITNHTPINYTMPAAFTISNNFNAANCKVIAILYTTSDMGVLQAAEADVQ